jgi:hypothetical protein
VALDDRDVLSARTPLVHPVRTRRGRATAGDVVVRVAAAACIFCYRNQFKLKLRRACRGPLVMHNRGPTCQRTTNDRLEVNCALGPLVERSVRDRRAKTSGPCGSRPGRRKCGEVGPPGAGPADPTARGGTGASEVNLEYTGRTGRSLRLTWRAEGLAGRRQGGARCRARRTRGCAGRRRDSCRGSRKILHRSMAPRKKGEIIWKTKTKNCERGSKSQRINISQFPKYQTKQTPNRSLSI